MIICQTARYSLEPGSLDRCVEAIREFVRHIKENEPDTVTYTSLRDAGEPSTFVHFMVFKHERAREAHANSEAAQRFTEVLYPETQAPVEYEEYKLIGMG